ncbi:MAG: GNAT family N-acetyltransferase [Sulfitobacter sp.]
MLKIAPATSDVDLAEVRRLCWDYHSFLLNLSGTDRNITETFYPVAKYAALMDGLAQEHARPGGIILLARIDGKPVGCGMTHAIGDHTCEVKRVFVSDAARGQGVAARLCTALMDQARTDGFKTMVLDTSKSLTGAQNLYSKLGFKLRGPYQPIPERVLPHLLFYEIAL